MSYSQTITRLITDAWTDGYVCLLGTSGPHGPNIRPKGSMMLFDDEYLAYWEPPKKPWTICSTIRAWSWSTAT